MAPVGGGIAASMYKF